MVQSLTLYFLTKLKMTAIRELDDTGLDVSNVLDWNGRSRRIRKPAPLTYWDEFVATDPWYIKELISDIPEEEYDAAFNDEDWSEGEESEELSDEDDENGSDCIDEGGDSVSTESPTVEASSADDTSDDDDASDASSDGGSEEDSAPSKRQRRS
jgi:hypothetical protein